MVGSGGLCRLHSSIITSVIMSSKMVGIVVVAVAHFLRVIAAFHFGGEDVRQPTVSWDTKTVDVRQGDNVTLTCTVNHVNVLDVVRLEHVISRDDQQAPKPEMTSSLIADNDDVKEAFKALGRYRVLYHVINGTATVQLHIHQIREEDSGSFICRHRRTQHDLYDASTSSTVARLSLAVRVAVSEVYLMTVTPYGYDGHDEQYRIGDGAELVLQQYERWGVVCVVTSLGHAPDVIITAGGRDVTGLFERSVDRRSVLLESGLTRRHVTVRLSYVTSGPEPEMNGHTLVCKAVGQTGFKDTRALAKLVVNYGPVIRCPRDQYTASVGDVSVVLSCRISANPGSLVTWSTAAGGGVQITDPAINVTIMAVSSDESIVYLLITRVAQRHFGDYSLTAGNMVGSARAVIRLLPTPPPSPSSLPPQTDTKASSQAQTSSTLSSSLLPHMYTETPSQPSPLPPQTDSKSRQRQRDARPLSSDDELQRPQLTSSSGCCRGTSTTTAAAAASLVLLVVSRVLSSLTSS